MGASIASLALAAPANANWNDPGATGGQIGIIDQDTATPGTQGATLVYPGQTAQSLDDVQLLLPNSFKNGDTIRLSLFDRSATTGANANGQINADAAHKLVLNGTPTATVNSTPVVTGTTIGPTEPTAGDTQNNPVPYAGADKPTQPPVFTVSTSSSSRAHGLGNDTIDLTVNGVQANGNSGAKWIVNLSGLKVDVGDGATPGEIRVVPFAYNGGPTDAGAFSLFGANILTSVSTVINRYTVPGYIAPVTLTVAAPSSLAADGTTQKIGDLTIAETNNFSLQAGTYQVDLDGGVVFRNGNTGDPITATLTNGATSETVTVTQPAAGSSTLSFAIAQGDVAAANSGKMSVVFHGVELADTNPAGPFHYTVSGGSITAGPNAFMVTADTSGAIPAAYAGDGSDRKGVNPDSLFYNGDAQVRQQDIVAPVTRFTAQSVSSNVRIGGIDRYSTAAKVAMNLAGCGNSATCPNGVGPALQSVVLASGENFPDALSGNFLAGSQRTAILLTRATSLPQATEDALCELGVQRVFIVGGTAAVSTGVENAVKGLQQHNQGCNGLLGSNAHIAVTRLAGADRFATNRVVNEYAAANNLNSTSVGTTNITFGVPAKRTAMVATGANFPDALAAGPATVFGNFPIILARGATLGTDGAAQFNDLGIQQAVIVGGTDVVSTAAETEITTAGAAVKRIAGADRYETATKLADFEITPQTATSTREGGLGFDGTPLGTADNQRAILSTGVNFADALAGGPLAAQFSAPILLTTPNPLSAVTQKWLDDHSSTYRVVQALGLGAAVSDAALTAANQAVSN